MKIKQLLGPFLLCFCFFAAFYLEIYADVNQSSASQITFKQDRLAIRTSTSDQHFTIEIAESPQQLRFGLMFRKTLPRDHGMLFLWTKDKSISMWMKNTLIPLDLIFIDSHGRIVNIATNTTPESTDLIPAGQPVRAVLELAGGTTEQQGIKVGDRVIYSSDELEKIGKKMREFKDESKNKKTR